MQTRGITLQLEGATKRDKHGSWYEGVIAGQLTLASPEGGLGSGARRTTFTYQLLPRRVTRTVRGGCNHETSAATGATGDSKSSRSRYIILNTGIQGNWASASDFPIFPIKGMHWPWDWSLPSGGQSTVPASALLLAAGRAVGPCHLQEPRGLSSGFSSAPLTFLPLILKHHGQLLAKDNRDTRAKLDQTMARSRTPAACGSVSEK